MWGLASKTKFRRGMMNSNENGAEESLLNTCKCGKPSTTTSPYQPLWHFSATLITVVNIILLSVSCGLLFVYDNHNASLNADLRRTSAFSPLHDILDLEPKLKKMNATVFPAKHGASVARELPNPTADEIWDQWERIVWLPITRKDILKMGKDPSTVVKLEHTTWGLGDDAYLADYSVSHQIHCLNSLRHFAYASYYNTTSGNPHKMGMKEIHINHCVDILLQSIQCSGDVNLITYHWLAGQDVPEPDMSINKQCVNFDKLTSFRQDHGLDKDKFETAMKKSMYPGVKELHQSDAYYEYFGEENPNHINGADLDNDFNL